jgi:DNA-binding NarL/FixJ family response regulator
MIRLLIVDDHPAYRRGLELMLAGSTDIEIVGEADTGERAVELATSHTPDVILMDLRMPGLDGIEATRRLSQSGSTAAIVVLTMFEDDDSVFAAMRAGARGYLLKGAEQQEIERAIRAAAAGEAIFGPQIAQRVVAHFAGGSGTSVAAFPLLTEREISSGSLGAIRCSNFLLVRSTRGPMPVSERSPVCIQRWRCVA